MAFIEWNDLLNTGIPGVDEQHRSLVALINTLHERMMEGKGRDVIGNVLEQLEDYTKEHFQKEEELMAQYDYPEREEHISIHRDFEKKLKGFCEELERGEFLVTSELLDYLKDWFVKHIKKTDQEYSRYIAKRISQE